MKIAINNSVPVELNEKQTQAFKRLVNKFGFSDALVISNDKEQASHMIDSLNEVKEIMNDNQGGY